MDDSTQKKPSSTRVRQRRRRGMLLYAQAPLAGDGKPRVVVDRYRSVVFPNRIREHRLRKGHPRLSEFANHNLGIHYIRLSKIERGEVFARADELRKIGAALDVPPADLLLDIDDPVFDIAAWFLPFADGTVSDSTEEAEFAILLAAAVRERRNTDERLTAATMDTGFGIPPVILSRIENAQKGLTRWNDQTVANLCKLFGVADEQALRDLVRQRFESGKLGRFMSDIANAEYRIARTRRRTASLRLELKNSDSDVAMPVFEQAAAIAYATRMVAVFGAPLADGLIAMTPTGIEIETPSAAGVRSFGLRVGRSTLGGGLPGQATVIVDPDRFPQAGGLALVRESEGYRILAVAIGKDGAMLGYSIAPVREVLLDGLAPDDAAAIVAAIFV